MGLFFLGMMATCAVLILCECRYGAEPVLVYARWCVADGQSGWLVGRLVFKRMCFAADGACHLWHEMELMMYF